VSKDDLWIVGVDEVGRGCLAGPVVVGVAAVQRKNIYLVDGLGLKDSKQLSPRKREALDAKLRELEKAGIVKLAVGASSSEMVDRAGINPAIHAAIEKAILATGIDHHECHVLLDGGLHAPRSYFKQNTFIKGDALYPIISGASIVAKVYRDALMEKLDEQYPAYGWYDNKGYGTKAHMDALKKHGLTELHRYTFCQALLQ
jgi:ribonuclease HII